MVRSFTLRESSTQLRSTPPCLPLAEIALHRAGYTRETRCGLLARSRPGQRGSRTEKGRSRGDTRLLRARVDTRLRQRECRGSWSTTADRRASERSPVDACDRAALEGEAPRGDTRRMRRSRSRSYAASSGSSSWCKAAPAEQARGRL